MKRNATTSTLFTVLALACLPGCGSGGGTSPDGGGGGGGATGSGNFTWKDGATLHTALFASGSRVKSASLDLVQITGSDSGSGVSFGVTLMPPPLVTGSYACSDNGAGTGRTVSIDYTVGGASSLAPTCAITMTTLGDATGTKVSGTFSATVPFSDGTTRTITEGKFDVSLTVSSI